jgi:ankyrin repeat protein
MRIRWFYGILFFLTHSLVGMELPASGNNDLHTALFEVFKSNNKMLMENEFDAIVQLVKDKPKLLNQKNDEEETPLHMLLSFHAWRKSPSREELLTLFLRNGANPLIKNSNGYNALHLAAREGWIFAAERISESSLFKDIINELDNDHRTPLQLTNTPEMAKWLIDHKAMVEAFAPQQQSPLYTAASHNYCSVIRVLLNRKTAINFADENGNTPLHGAAKHGAAAATQLLLKRGAKPNVENNDGITPLHLAVQCQAVATIRRLLEKGANPDMKTACNVTARELAQQSGYYARCSPLSQGLDQSLEERLNALSVPKNHAYNLCNIRYFKKSFLRTRIVPCVGVLVLGTVLAWRFLPPNSIHSLPLLAYSAKEKLTTMMNLFKKFVCGVKS